MAPYPPELNAPMRRVSSEGARWGDGLVLKMLAMREVRDMALLDCSDGDSYDAKEGRFILRSYVRDAGDPAERMR